MLTHLGHVISCSDSDGVRVTHTEGVRSPDSTTASCNKGKQEEDVLGSIQSPWASQRSDNGVTQCC